MKEINDQLYGYSYELDQTSEDDGTTCFAVDNGSVYVAYSGIWYEQPVKWAAGTGSSGGGGGSSSGPLVVTVTETDNGDDTYTFTCDKTAGEMYEAAPNLVFLFDDGGMERVGQLFIFSHADGYGYSFIARDLFDLDSTPEFATNTDSTSEYPTYLLDQGGSL